MENYPEIEEGTIKVSSEVIGSIAMLAATEIEGIIGLKGNLVNKIAELFGKKYERGVKVEINEKDVRINLSIIIQYGTIIPEVAAKVQQNVKKRIEDLVGLNVVRVDVNVQSVQIFEKAKKTSQPISFEEKF